MIFGLLFFCVVILCVNRSRSSFILYRIVKRHTHWSVIEHRTRKQDKELENYTAQNLENMADLHCES